MTESVAGNEREGAVGRPSWRATAVSTGVGRLSIGLADRVSRNTSRQRILRLYRLAPEANQRRQEADTN